ncbi:3-keto-5-aminohexanoate cleavage protein [Saccharibacillus deserti]|uniref:3-keto-5-aminohexanoate cleavage protein n=1 Tax=Saccharibacillus deserti TaxID=1634444 RepID=UPI0015540EF2|nr:3-keto-5-aminohexanoate cleavage protein [Saccharibacillus deserti]
MLQACLNGSRSRNDHPAVPCTPEEIALDAEKTVRAGAAELHIHIRDAGGVETLEAADVARTPLTVRERLGGVPIGISTAASILSDSGTRIKLMRSWTALPDYVSVNIREPDSEWIAAAALFLGIGAEAGLCSESDAERFVAMPGCESCMRVPIGVRRTDRP